MFGMYPEGNDNSLYFILKFSMFWCLAIHPCDRVICGKNAHCGKGAKCVCNPGYVGDPEQICSSK